MAPFYTRREDIAMTEHLTEHAKRAKAALDAAALLLIGGGAGLSAAAGLRYDGPRFTENFGDFIARYHMADMYTAAFYPFQTGEERWAYWGRHIGVNRYDPPALPLYRDLLALAGGKPYFAVTTNVDHQFYKAGFDPQRLFAVQGDYGLLQCAKACHGTLYGNEALVAELRANTADCKVPGALVPHCPVCGGPMEVNLRKDNCFVEDAAWHAAQGRYRQFLDGIGETPVVLLELGVGFNTPGIIRFPFEQLAHRLPNATLVRINRDNAGAIAENRHRTVCFDEDMREVLHALQA